MNPRAEDRVAERGFALLVLLAIVAAGSMTVLFAVRSFVPPLADQAPRVDVALTSIEQVARGGYLRNGAFPADLDAVGTAGGFEVGGAWRTDPWGWSQDYDYRITGGDLQIASRGADHLVGTADDMVHTVDAEQLLRLRQRARLRMLRALFAVSPYRDAASMTAADRTAMHAAMREQAICKRLWYGASSAERTVLTSRMAVATATIATLVAAHSCPALPVAITGAGGLMQAIGAADASALDGLGRPLASDAVLGVVAVGTDGAGGTNDDM